MAEVLRSVGLDVGTTTTQLIVSQLRVENRASSFSVPDVQITERKVCYESPIHFTPLLQGDLVDGDGIRRIVEQEYAQAGIRREDVDTGAIIITGETSRKENAGAVLSALSDLAGDFVVATAGPDLESVLAAKGAGADAYSVETGKRVLHIDIGGGTSNLAWIDNGVIIKTGCLNVGGRLLKMKETGEITYVSPILADIFCRNVGKIPSPQELEALTETLVSALEMAAGLRPKTELLDKLWTQGSSPWESLWNGEVVMSFSGGVADCIENTYSPFAFGDIGPLLGQAIRKSKLCQGVYRLGTETIRATVIGAGCHSAQLSGSTVFYRHIQFPMKNLPVVHQMEELRFLDQPGVLALPGISGAHYQQIQSMAEDMVKNWPDQPIFVALEADMAKALGHALALRADRDRPILCIDRVQLTDECYLDVGAPVGDALPLVVKTLVLKK